MSKLRFGVLPVVALSMCVLSGCGAKAPEVAKTDDVAKTEVVKQVEPAADVKQTATRTYEVDGTRVVASIDVSDGYSVEFASGAVYLYKGENGPDGQVCAFGYLESQEDYETIIKENEGKLDEVGGGVIYNDGYNYAYYVGENQYFMIAVQQESGVDPDSVYARFDVHIDDMLASDDNASDIVVEDADDGATAEVDVDDGATVEVDAAENAS